MKFNLVRQDDTANLTVFHDGEMYVADNTHPNFNRIVEGVLSGDTDAIALFDVSKTAAERFERVSRRVTVAGGVVFFDGEPVDNVLTKQIVRFLDEGTEDFKPLANFFEKIAANPSQHSRKQLFEWLDRHNFALTPDGDFIAYKGVRADFTSIHTGPAIVDGKAVNGHVPNPVGSIVEIARGQVAFDPGVGCSTGLHVGTWSYAHGFAQGATLKVKVNPADVVSVPTDCDAQKMRVCRYEVLEQVAAPETAAYDDLGWDNDFDEVAFCDNCGDEFYDAEVIDGLCNGCFDAQDTDEEEPSIGSYF